MHSKDLQFIDTTLRQAGSLILSAFGGKIQSAQKKEKSQIVTELDLASEKLIIEAIKKSYPQSSVLAEESGLLVGDATDYWIVDPIDGTSNFANGMPWFGVMMAHVYQGEAVSSGIYLPVSNEMYLGERYNGAYKNGTRFVVRKEEDIAKTLVAYGMDGSEVSCSRHKKAEIFEALLPNVLNLRSTNSAVDYAYAAEGRLGGLINLENRIWDIAPVLPIALEAGCKVSDVFGKPISFQKEHLNASRNFTLLLASGPLHAALLTIIRPILSE
jgi:myo-inositol-1(or 4)-monophosphatase